MANKAVVKPSISNESVVKATGKNWKQWFALLKKDKAQTMPHKEIAKLAADYGAGMWWAQMVTVEFERVHGLREVHQKCDGTFAASGSITIAVPLESLYQAWANEKQREKWLPAAPIHIRKANLNKSLRITWDGGPSSVTVNFYSKSYAKSQVTVDHEKLKNNTEVTRKKAYWKKSLQALKQLLEEA